MTDFEQHLTRQIAWSRATFGPGTRQAGVIDHIRKELVEVEEAKSHKDIVKEWTDVAILALDGLWRAIGYPVGYTSDRISVLPTPAIARDAVGSILAKHDKNELRNWPDWRTAPADKAIEHVRNTNTD